MRSFVAIAGAALLAGAIVASTSSAEPGPPPPDDAPVIAASCGASRTVEPFYPIPAAVTPLPAAMLPTTGRLRFRWGYRIATGDSRVGNVTGLSFSSTFGLLAVTRDRQWLSLDLQGGTLAGLRTVGVAAMKGAPGVPTSLATPYEERTFVAFAGAHPVIARFALASCGTASTAVPWLSIVGTTEPVVVQAAATYLGIAGRHAREGGTVVWPFDRRAVTLTGSNPLVAGGDTLVAASNPARIVPEIIVARRGGGRAKVALVPVEAWSDVRGGPARPETPLDTLPRAPDAMASIYSRDSRATLVIFAYPGPHVGTLDLYAFDADVGL